MFCVITILKSVVFVIHTECPDSVGIIDGNISIKHDNIIYSENTYINNKTITHGDEMIQFIHNCQSDIEVYYYDASDQNGEVYTDSIIEGLEWMLSNNIKRVNISMSNKVKHDLLQNWISEHKEIKVFASYNNKLNSYDYPAMYAGVYASGSSRKINYKEIDINYCSNNILVINYGIKIYHGNSFLSVHSMLRWKNNFR